MLTAQNIKFISPDKDYLESYLEALKEGLEIQPVAPERIEKITSDFNGWLNDFADTSKLVVLENGQEVQRAPQTEIWLLQEDRFIGRVGIRHFLTDALKNEGGHIGYAVRKSERRKGYGYLLLKEGLKIAKDFGIDEVLLTCNEQNAASIKIIESCGGILRNKSFVYDGIRLNRYYIVRI